MSTAVQVMIEPIGVIESPFVTVESPCDYRSESQIVLWPELSAGLVGIEYFSHLWVIYRQHRSAEWLRSRGWSDTPPLVLPGDDERAGQGVFSTRAPCRPAGLGSCIVLLLRREGNRLVVRGLDALHGTPLIDVKPYVPQFDAFPDAVVPLHWAKVMQRPDDTARLSRELHCDTSNADFALGMRTGVIALKRLGSARGEALLAEADASAFFAQGFEMATGCSPLRGTLVNRTPGSQAASWRVRLVRGNQSVELNLGKIQWPDAAAVFAEPEEGLYDEAKKTPPV